MHQFFRWIVPFAALFLVSCGAQEAIEDASNEVTMFHNSLDSEDYEGIWRSTGPALREVTSQEDFTKLLSAVHLKLGDVESTEQVNWRVNSTTDGTFAIVVMDTVFVEGTGQETFTFQREGEGLNLVGYNINSADMMIN